MVETGQTLNASIENIVSQLQQCVDNFSALSKTLLAIVKHDTLAAQSVATYIELLEYNITGNYYWS